MTHLRFYVETVICSLHIFLYIFHINIRATRETDTQNAEKHQNN